MDQILMSLTGSLDTVGGPDDAELPGEINDVMEALESVDGATETLKTEPVNIEERLDKCVEKQLQLESHYKNLQIRINRLRSGKLSCNARDVLASVVTSCDKRRARLQGETGPDTKTEAQPGSGTENQSADNGEKKVVRIKKYNKSRSDEVLGQLHTQLRHVQNYLDPDATESSSGGESGDEMDKAQAGAELYAPLQERAKYRWYLRRAQLASQWVWLQAQVSDLEYKIRQHTELYRSQRLGKGSVQLGEEVVSWPPHSKLAVSSSPDTVPLSCPVPNKVYGSSNDSEASSEDESSRTCCRVRPVKRVRRRKLVDTYGLHHTVARAAKLSTVSCQCLRPEQWCVLCLGRRSHSLSVSTDKRARAENVALLDHSYHTVLSDPSTHTQLNLVLMENLTNRRWLVRQPTGAPVQPGQPLHLSRVININDREKDKKMKNKDKPDLDLKRKYIKRKDRDGRIVKRRRKLDSERDSRPDSPLDMVSGSVVGDLNIKAVRDGVERIRDKITQKKRKSSYDIDHIVIPMSMAASTRVEKLKYKEIITPSWREVNNPEEEKELVSLPVSQEQEKDSKVEVKEEVKDEVKEEGDEKITNTVKGTEETDKNTDVITNDVTDEVNGKDKSEKKDAVTVKDEVEEDMEVEDDFEDISDLAYKLRHCKAEEEERVRWATPLGRVHGGQRGHHGRGRARRLDSCRTEASSGANTPNPLSPEAIEDIVVATRPSSPQPESSDTSAQTTPLIEAVTSPGPPPGVGEMSSPPPGLLPPTPISSVPASVRGRRRTSSQTKSRDRNLSEASQHSQESSRSTSPWIEIEDRVETPPWERRSFPLSEEDLRQLEADEKTVQGDKVRDRVDQPSLSQPPSSATVSLDTSRATSRSVEVRLVKLRSDIQHYRSSSVEEAQEEAGDSADPDWEDNEEEDTKDEVGDDDPEYDPEKRERGKKSV